MTDNGGTELAASRRDRRRQETIDDIKAVARRQLSRGGPLAVSMRGIARELDMTAGAVHYYFPGLHVLLDALVVDGYRSLAATLRESYQDARQHEPDQCWVTVCTAHRAWALSRPSEYMLLYGHDGRAITRTSPQAAQAMADVIDVLLDMMDDAVAHGDVDAARIEASISPPLLDQIASWRRHLAGREHLPLGALAAAMVGFAELHGAITTELIGTVPPQLTDLDSLFGFRMAHIARSLRPPGRSPAT